MIFNLCCFYIISINLNLIGFFSFNSFMDSETETEPEIEIEIEPVLATSPVLPQERKYNFEFFFFSPSGNFNGPFSPEILAKFSKYFQMFRMLLDPSEAEIGSHTNHLLVGRIKFPTNCFLSFNEFS